MDLKCSQLAPSAISPGLEIGFIGSLLLVPLPIPEYTLTQAQSMGEEY